MVNKVKKFHSIALYSSKKSKRANQIFVQLIEIAENLKLKVIYPNSSSLIPSKKGRLVSDTYVKNNADIVIAIGGDGTLLSCSRKFGLEGLPILGINLGNLGFLNDIDPTSLTDNLLEILKGNYIVDKRFFLETSINKTKSKDVALNEVVIHSGSIAQLIEFEVYVDETFVYRQKADGIIINTPTGSTAYALSGHGPIIHPEVNAISLLPMFPHSLNTRPLIVDESARISVIPSKKSFISYDSHTKKILNKNDIVEIKKTSSKLNLIHPLNHDFYSACRNKLGWSLGIPNKNETVNK